jgi:predicted phage-related endonuclease
MKKLNLVQGTKEWLGVRMSHFTASEAPMMMGVSKFFSRTQLLDHKKGWITEIDTFTQKRFDEGHRAEEMARPLAEQFADEDFVAVVGVLEDTKYLASFDGYSMLGDVLFEHKGLNKVLAENVLNNVLAPEYYWQLEHQLLVSGADKVLFVCSDGTEEKFYSMWYESIPERRAELIAGWDQFAIDLANHVPEAKAEKVSAEVIRDLPAITYKMNGLSLISNLDDYKAAANNLVEKSRQIIETDQDFANAEARQKVFTKAEKDIAELCDRVLGEVADIDAFTKDLKYIGAQIREARLSEAKQITKRKEDIRLAILTDAKGEIDKAINDAETRVKCRLPNLACDVLQAMKGKKTIDSLKDAAATEVANGKIEVTNHLNTALSNMATIRELAPDQKHLFNDWPSIAFKANDDFTALVKTRLIDEQARVEAERAKIRAEEEAKATAAAEAKLRAEQADIARKQAEQEAAQKAEADRIERDKLKVGLTEAERNHVALANQRARETMDHKEQLEAEALREMQERYDELEIENQPEQIIQRQVIGTASKSFLPKHPSTAFDVLSSYEPIGNKMPSMDIRMGGGLVNELCKRIESLEGIVFQAKSLLKMEKAA